MREQAHREECGRLVAQLTALDYAEPDAALGLMSRPPTRTRAHADDPLERLWKLPAGRPRGPRVTMTHKTKPPATPKPNP